MDGNFFDKTYIVTNARHLQYLTLDYQIERAQLPQWETPEIGQTASSNPPDGNTRRAARAQFFLGCIPIIWRLGSQPGELRLHIEPLHALSPEEFNAEMLKIARRYRIPVAAITTGGLTLISRSLLDAMHPGVDFFESFNATQDLFLYDPLTGFIILDRDGHIGNDWFGGKVEIADLLQKRNAPRERLLFTCQGDLLNVGVSVWEKALQGIGLFCKKDEAEIPTITVSSQNQLDQLIERITQACHSAPFGVTPVYRGQTGEYLLPDRRILAHAEIAAYSNIRDHSLLPSIYRKFEDNYAEPDAYLRLINDLLKWHFYERAIFTADFPSQAPPTGAANAQTSIFAGATTDFRSLASGMRSTTEFIDKNGNVIKSSETQHRLVHEDVRRNLVLQHYGAPTPVIDVTSDHRVAEFFAFTKLKTSADGAMTCSPSADSGSSVLYVMLVPDGMAPLYRSDLLIEPKEALRPSRQSCLTLGGSGVLYRNYCSRFIGLKIKFTNAFIPRDLPSAKYLFPGTDEDPMLRKLLTVEKFFGRTANHSVYWLRDD